MIKRIICLVMIFILGLSASALAAEPASRIIEGRVVNGTAGGSSVADQNITLKTYLNDAEVDATSTETDAEGRFVFDDVSAESGYDYQVVLTFQDAEYYSEWLSFAEGETTRSVEAIVYDSTTSDEAIKVTMTHTIIYVGQDSLQFMEYFLFVNEADRTYIGSEESVIEGKRETLRFFLPQEATELQITMGLMECCIMGSEEGFIDTMPVLPGGKEMAYSYTVDYNAGVHTLSQRVYYPITNLDLLIQGESVEVASDRLTVSEPMDIEGVRFKHFSGRDFAPGDILVAQLSGLLETNTQGVIKWVALALVVLVVGASLGYLLRKKRLQPVGTEDNLDLRRQRLLVELAQLDDNFESGKIPEDAYRRLRAEWKAQLVELMRRSKEEGGNG